MTQEQVQKLKLGVYRIFWKSGGSSVASVGQLHSGKKWYAPCNWVSKNASGIACTKWRYIKRVKLIQI